MKKIAILVFLAISIISCKDNTKFVINGEILNDSITAKKVFLNAINANNEMVTLDSAIISDTKKFDLSYAAKDLDFYQIVLNNNIYPIVAKNGNEIHIAIEDKKVTVKGTDEDQVLAQYYDLSNKFNQEMIETSNKFQKLIEKDSVNAQLYGMQNQQKFREIFGKYGKQFLEKAQSNQTYLSSYLFILMIGGSNRSPFESEVLSYAKNIKGKFTSPILLDFISKKEALDKISIGNIAPEFSAQSPVGEIIKLSDYRGKFLLLDFWASWCGPCRQENPNLVKIYQQYKNKNFTILGFSLDSEAANWNKAIKQDQLTWDQVSELQGWESPIALTYGINEIPSSLLLNPEGKIIAKNLRGKELEDFLASQLK